MKNSSFLSIILALGLLVVSYKWVESTNAESPVAESPSSTVEDIMTRTSVRAYSDRAVSPETIDTLLRAAMSAPTAGNKQPWRFVVITDRAIMDTIASEFGSMTMMSRAGAAIVVCGDPEVTFPGEGREYWVQDASAATENLLLAAHAVGLGAVWCGVYPMSDRVARFSGLLHLPSGILPLNCIALGYPGTRHP